jgi:hypothetical protein
MPTLYLLSTKNSLVVLKIVLAAYFLYDFTIGYHKLEKSESELTLALGG